MIRRITKAANTGNCDVNTKLTIQFPTELASKKVLVTSFIFDHTGGGAANHQGRWFDGASGSTANNDTIYERYKTSSVVVATPLTGPTSTILNGPLVLLLDANARAYFKPGPDVNNNNTYQWIVEYHEFYQTSDMDTTN
jgi:hypothetical protein